MSKPIPPSQGTAMIKTYEAYMRTLGVDMKKQTHSVSFKLPELMAWLSKMAPIADEIRVFMGDYPDGAQEAGRTTVILWPYKDGRPARTTDSSLASETDPELPPADDLGNGDDDGSEGPGDDKDGLPADPFNDGGLNP